MLVFRNFDALYNCTAVVLHDLFGFGLNRPRCISVADDVSLAMELHIFFRSLVLGYVKYVLFAFSLTLFCGVLILISVVLDFVQLPFSGLAKFISIALCSRATKAWPNFRLGFCRVALLGHIVPS